jgi:hypothetical protein
VSHRNKLSKLEWKYIIIDEAQRMKDRESKLSQVRVCVGGTQQRRWAARMQRRLVLSALARDGPLLAPRY